MVKIYTTIPEELEEGLQVLLDSLPEMKESSTYQYEHYKKVLEPPKGPFIESELLDVSQDIPHGLEKNVNHFNPIEAEATLIDRFTILYPEYDIRVSGRHIYPPGGHLGWHTNSNQPGKRIYITYVTESDKSFFRYIQDGEQVTSYDKEGWNMREFNIGDPPLWHCVFTEVERLSVGFHLTSKKPA